MQGPGSFQAVFIALKYNTEVHWGPKAHFKWLTWEVRQQLGRGRQIGEQVAPNSNMIVNQRGSLEQNLFCRKRNKHQGTSRNKLN